MKKILLSVMFILLLCGCQPKEKIVERYITQEPEIVYVEVPVEVEKPVVEEKIVEVEKIVEKPIEVEKIIEKEVIKEVEVEKIVEVEKPIYVEKSYANINGLDVQVLDNNLYRIEFDLTRFEYKTNTGTYDAWGMDIDNSINNQFLKLFNSILTYTDGYQGGKEYYGTIKSNNGYIIKKLMIINLEHYTPLPKVCDINYDRIYSNEETPRTVAGEKFTYEPNQENVIISIQRTESALYEYRGANKIIVEFSLRGE